MTSAASWWQAAFRFASAAGAGSLINTVLDIAEIKSGQFTLNMTEYAIENVEETVRAPTESLAQNKKLTLKTRDRQVPAHWSR